MAGPLHRMGAASTDQPPQSGSTSLEGRGDHFEDCQLTRRVRVIATVISRERARSPGSRAPADGLASQTGTRALSDVAERPSRLIALASRGYSNLTETARDFHGPAFAAASWASRENSSMLAWRSTTSPDRRTHNWAAPGVRSLRGMGEVSKHVKHRVPLRTSHACAQLGLRLLPLRPAGNESLAPRRGKSEPPFASISASRCFDPP